MCKSSKFKAQSLKIKILTPNSKLRIPNSDGGFTLLEVMIALAIISGVIVTTLVSLNYHLGIINDDINTIVAALLGREKMEEIVLSGFPEEKKGDFGEDFPQFSWQMNIENMQFKGLKLINIRVLWEKGKEVSYVSYKFEKEERFTIPSP